MINLMRLIVIHGHCMLRPGLIEMLERDPSIEVCAVSANLDGISEKIYEHRPDLMFVNVSPKCSCGMPTLERLKKDFAGIKIIAFSCSMEFEDMYAGLALHSGADGYVSAADDPSDMLEAIRTVCQGKRYITPQVSQHQSRLHSLIPQFAALSQREAEVFCLIGCGYITKRIADLMNIKVKTVETYRERIRDKLNISTGGDLLYTAVSFMRSASRRGIGATDDVSAIREWLLAIG